MTATTPDNSAALDLLIASCADAREALAVLAVHEGGWREDLDPAEDIEAGDLDEAHRSALLRWLPDVPGTLAEQVAARFGGDGRCLDSAGCDLADVAGKLSPFPDREQGETRWVFSDASRIVLAHQGGVFDIGPADAGEDCWCWAGSGHSEGCTSRSA